jgi:deoxyribodipyrimidine photo-lyase
MLYPGTFRHDDERPGVLALAMTLEHLQSDPRVTVRRGGAPDADGLVVLYWMQRALRASDNPALDVAIALGNMLHKPVVVFFGLHPHVQGAALRQYHFLAEGLRDLAEGLDRRRVSFLLQRFPDDHLQPVIATRRPAIVVGDENPLREAEAWRQQITDAVTVPFWTVDADVVVPSNLIHTEQYAARTIRPRIHQHLETFLAPTSEPVASVTLTPPAASSGSSSAASPAILDGLPIDRSVPAVDTLRGGIGEARRRLGAFIDGVLPHYAERRNHPEMMATSQLSPYLHFGQMGPREVARAVIASAAPRSAVDAFIEQLVVRRELAINYVRFNPAYDSLNGCEAWARRTLRRHQFDVRAHRYGLDALDAAETHDPLWNAAQRQMTHTGWMHGYVRMYWAKKILEWSADPAEAFTHAVLLNDRYELDGRDPNGYASIAWAIGGKHDRPWPTRPVYGAIRSMSLTSTARKFDAAAYIEQHGTPADIDAFGRTTRTRG